MKRIFVLCAFLTVILCSCQRKITSDNEHIVSGEKTVTMNDVTFKAEKAEVCKEVKPEKPNGYYHYYEEKDGYSYYVISGVADNAGAYDLQTENILVKGINGNKKYEAKLLFSNKDKSDLIKEIRKKESLTFYIIVLMKDESLNPNKLEIYYTKDFKTPADSHKYDESIIWTLPSFTR